MNHDDDQMHCRICGLLQATPPWGEAGTTPTFDYCDCCGVQFGYQDSHPAAIRRFRSLWLAKGAHWDNKSAKPVDWDGGACTRQLARIPPEHV